MLSDPPQVLSAQPLCCQCRRTKGAQLRRLSIKVDSRLGELHGEQGLNAGVQVEGFTCPARSNGAGIGILEAVHRSRVIILCLLALPPQRDIEMLGQILVAHPRVAGSAVWFVEYPTAAVPGDGDAAFMHGGVMPLAQQDQIVEIGTGTGNPWDHVMGLQVPGLMTARVLAHRVPDHQCPALRLADQTAGTAQGKHVSVFVDNRAQQRAVTGMSLCRSGLDRADAINVAGRLSRLGGADVPAGTSRRRFSADTCTTTRVRSSPERSSGAVWRKPRATSHSASALL